MAAPVAGKVTFISPGAKTVYIGIPTNKLTFTAGGRDGTVESDGLFSFGFACPTKQYTHAVMDGKSQTTQGTALMAYDLTGGKAIEFTVTGGWGTGMINFNVVSANPSYPFELIAET